MMTARKSEIHPIDRHVGARLRLRRLELNLSQAALASRLGLTFQAVQKYEAGAVRIAASRLYEMARALDAAPAYFFDGYGGSVLHEAGPTFERRDVATLLRGYAGIADPALQAELRRLIAMLGEGRE
jgi:transcriptional regulator with XRE-family HTH domain